VIRDTSSILMSKWIQVTQIQVIMKKIHFQLTIALTPPIVVKNNNHTVKTGQSSVKWFLKKLNFAKGTPTLIEKFPPISH